VKIYTALLKSGAEPILVKEGFAWGAVLLGPLWLLAHRAWIAAAISLAACVLIAVLVPAPASDILLLAVACGLGFIGNDLRRWALEHRGYLLTHVLAAGNRDAAFLRLLTYRPDLAVRYRPEPT
jgi:Protein of unknown function (DUF2628)